jgi:hypothetical protein
LVQDGQNAQEQEIDSGFHDSRFYFVHTGAFYTDRSVGVLFIL